MKGHVNCRLKTLALHDLQPFAPAIYQSFAPAIYPCRANAP